MCLCDGAAAHSTCEAILRVSDVRLLRGPVPTQTQAPAARSPAFVVVDFDRIAVLESGEPSLRRLWRQRSRLDLVHLSLALDARVVQLIEAKDCASVLPAEDVGRVVASRVGILREA